LAQALLARHEVSVFFRHDDPAGSPFAEHDEEVGGVLTRRVSCRPHGIRASIAGEFWGTFLNRQIEASFAAFCIRFSPI